MSSQHLTVCYQTCRTNPQLAWFLESFARERASHDGPVKLVIVDFHAQDETIEGAVWVPPKPCVWQGPFRLTKENYFAAANSRNTGLCYAPDGWIAYVDDLSVLMPGWLSSIREAMSGNYIVLGAYKKVKDLVVEKGAVKSCTEFPSGIDSRWGSGANCPVQASGSWLFGCSFAAPVEALLTVNGSDENADGLGSEDYLLGIRLQNAGYTFRYDRRMLTLESEELHHIGTPFKRRDKGVSPNDKSHALLRQAEGSRWAPNYFGEGGIRALRDIILAGGNFPISQIPDRDWFDGQPLSEL